MKRRLLELLLLLVILGFLGFVVVVSGIIPVKASLGHLPLTRAFLSFAMRRSVETHAMGVHVPDLEDQALVLRGAGHYDRGCQPCHGAPGEPASLITRALTPHPPYLPEAVTRWDPPELFEIVKHGIKMTGMPAWPALQRDDEVWAVVAFIRELPGMDAARYRQLAWGPLADSVEAPGMGRLAPLPRQLAEACIQCHGEDGLGRGVGAFPRIAGQSPAYLAGALRAYAEQERHSGIMMPMTPQLDPVANAVAADSTKTSVGNRWGDSVPPSADTR